jgi:4'-phosphopantetheinyl transferase EntD
MHTSPFGPEICFCALSSSDEKGELLPEERKALGPQAVQKRLDEFTLGRQAARNALRDLGFVRLPAIGVGSKGEPLWPDGITGSISHSDSWAVAAVAKTSLVRGIGLDLQMLRRKVHPGLAERICTAAEQHMIGTETFAPDVLEIFSAKETCFKLLFPLCRVFIAFHDVELTAQNRGFRAELKRSLGENLQAGFTFEVAVQKEPESVLTSAVLRQAGASARHMTAEFS